jgi:hypothetical protein
LRISPASSSKRSGHGQPVGEGEGQRRLYEVAQPGDRDRLGQVDAADPEEGAAIGDVLRIGGDRAAAWRI